MADVLTDFSKASMVQAIEANLFAFFHYLSNWPRVEVRDDGQCVFTVSDLPYPLFNSVMRATFDDDRAGKAIEARIRSCRSRGVPMLWWTGPTTRPSDLGDRLSEYGFVLEPAFGMTADLHADHSPNSVFGSDPESGVAIERVGDRATLDRWSEVLCDAFGASRNFGQAFAEMAEAIGLDGGSPFWHYLGRVNGQPAATCSLFLGAGVAGIYDVSTRHEHRRAGLGAAVTRRAMRDARALGYRMAILHASQLGLGMYRSLGFETICDIGQHVWVPEQ
jgi:GNAT superfamily N-acetyltransferase